MRSPGSAEGTGWVKRFGGLEEAEENRRNRRDLEDLRRFGGDLSGTRGLRRSGGCLRFGESEKILEGSE